MAKRRPMWSMRLDTAPGSGIPIAVVVTMRAGANEETVTAKYNHQTPGEPGFTIARIIQDQIERATRKEWI